VAQSTANEHMLHDAKKNYLVSVYKKSTQQTSNTVRVAEHASSDELVELVWRTAHQLLQLDI